MKTSTIDAETALDLGFPTSRSLLHFFIPQCCRVLALDESEQDHKEGVDCGPDTAHIKAPSAPDRCAVE